MFSVIKLSFYLDRILSKAVCGFLCRLCREYRLCVIPNLAARTLGWCFRACVIRGAGAQERMVTRLTLVT